MIALVFLHSPQVGPGKTHKKEWDRFDRSSKCALNFPSSLKPMLLRKKQELFNIWLDNSQDWDKVKCAVERQQLTSNLNRKEWTAVQAKTLKAEMSEDRFNDIIKKRTESGLYYQDEDYPSDPMDRGSKHVHRF